MLQSRSVALRRLARRYEIPRPSRISLISIGTRLFGSARPLPDEDFDDEESWKQHSYRPRTQSMTPSPRRILPPFSPPAPNNQQVNGERVVNGDARSVPQQELHEELSLSDIPGTSLFTSPSVLAYGGDAEMPITSKLHIITPQEDTPRGIWPVFRLMVGS